MAEISEERIEIIRNNIDEFLEGRITIEEITTLIGTKNRGTVSRHMKKLLSNEPEKMKEFEKLTDSKTGRRERYLILYRDRIKENFDNIISRKMTKRALAKELGINEMTLGSLIEEIYKDKPEKIEEYKEVKILNSRTRREIY